MTDPATLTEDHVRTLTGEDLDRAVEYWVYGDEWLSFARECDAKLRAVLSQVATTVTDADARPRRFHADANLCLPWFEKGGPLHIAALDCYPEWAIAVYGLTRPVRLADSTFMEAACRAAVLVKMREKAKEAT